jgi:uncharacterized protein YoxC
MNELLAELDRKIKDLQTQIQALLFEDEELAEKLQKKLDKLQLKRFMITNG